MADVDLDARLDVLFASEPKEFTAVRDVLVRDLKAAGRADESVEVKALRKPTVAVAAVNRTARQLPGEIAELMELGDELAALQADTATDRDELRELARQRRTLLHRNSPNTPRARPSGPTARARRSQRRSMPRRSTKHCETTSNGGG